MFSRQTKMPGDIADTFSTARPATLVRNGSTQGSQTVTLSGTPNLNEQQYFITYTRVIDGYSYVSARSLYLTRSQLTLPLAARTLTNHLNMNTDVVAVQNGNDITISPKQAGMNVSISFSSGSSLIATQSAVVNATAPMVILPGTVVGFSVDPANGEKIIVPIGSADFSALNAGVVVRRLTPYSRTTTENQIYDVLTRGTIWMRLAGTAPLLPATAAVQLGNFDSTTPGQIGVAGLTATKFTTVQLMQANGQVSKFHILDKNVPVGGLFRLELK